jgi:hypothetical protein
MSYLATGLIIAWGAGLLFLVGRALNFTRVVYNNISPGKNYWKPASIFRFYFFSFHFTEDMKATDPASLTETGRDYREKVIRNDRIIFAWILAGFVLIVWASRYFMAS